MWARVVIFGENAEIGPSRQNIVYSNHSAIGETNAIRRACVGRFLYRCGYTTFLSCF
jgi:hypothetical protein